MKKKKEKKKRTWSSRKTNKNDADVVEIVEIRQRNDSSYKAKKTVTHERQNTPTST